MVHKVAEFLLAWFIVSIPASIFIGKFIAAGSRDPKPKAKPYIVRRAA